ncbi:hypothetical protein BDF14DRAFT_1844838 [Spinellus fusiger]|nr:hypothetical protein BDF14DRAFT_1844838 [Spinellus fusiger]
MDVMENEQEICRVCRCEATEEEPLFYPCKCSGSIRYVHQTCLAEWLDHSKREPDNIPYALLMWQIIKRAFNYGCFIVRFILALGIWFLLLPYCTIQVWRLCLWSAEKYSKLLLQEGFSSSISTTAVQSIAGIVNATDPSVSTTRSTSKNNTLSALVAFVNTTANHRASDISSVSGAGYHVYSWLMLLVRLINWVDENPFIRQLIIDCYEGQAIELLVIVAVMCAAGVRGWVLQNMPAEIDPIDPLEINIPIMDNIQAEDLMEEVQPNVDPMQRGVIDEPLFMHIPAPEVFEGGVDNVVDDEEPEDIIDPPVEMELALGEEDPQFVPPLARREPIAILNNNNNNNNAAEEEDILEGLLDIMGIQGPLSRLWKNTSVTLLLVVTTLLVAGWVPYIVGVTVILCKPTDLFHLFLNGVHMIKNDFVRVTAWIYHSFIMPQMSEIRQHYIASLINTYFTFIHKAYQEIWISTLTVSDHMPRVSSALFSGISPFVTEWIHNSTVKSIQNVLHHHWTALTVYIHNAAIGNAPYQQLACIFAGYNTFAVLGLLYLSKKNIMYARLGRTMQAAAHQQAIAFKVALFVFLEIIVFPFVCGLLLDVSLLPSSPKVILSSRMAFFEAYLIDFIMCHWFIGVAFLVCLVRLIRWVREAVRPGVMWFIQNPKNHGFNPLREIAERPFFTQLWRLSVGTLVYFSIILLSLGAPVWYFYLKTEVLPLRWHASLSSAHSVVITLLLVYLVLPAVFVYYKFKQNLSLNAKWWITILCHQLRLTSFILGRRVSSEEVSYYYPTWKAWIYGQHEDSVFHSTGQFALAPNNDNVKRVHGRRMLMPISPVDFLPLDPEDRRLGHPANIGRREGETNTVVVYLPPHLGWRVFLLIITLWVSLVVFLFTATLGLVVMGRWIIEKASIIQPREMNDVYAYYAGFIIMFILLSAILKCVHIWHSVRREGRWTYAAVMIGDTIYESMRWVAKVGFLFVTCCIIIPILLGIFLELYIHVYWTEHGSMKRSDYYITLWERGLTAIMIFRYFYYFSPQEARQRDWHLMFPSDDVRDLNIPWALKRTIGPVILISSLLIAIPYITASAVSHLLSQTDIEDQHRTMQWSYLAFSSGIVLYFLGQQCFKAVKGWVGSIHEDIFLVGRTLHNFEGSEQVAIQPPSW